MNDKKKYLNNFRIFLILFVMLSGGWAASAYAQLRYTKGDSSWYVFSPVVVTGARYSTSQNNLAARVTVLAPEQLEQSTAISVADAVAKLTPGAFVTRRGVAGYGVGTSGTGTISMRGLGGKPNTQVLILIDGRPDFMGIFGHPLPDAYPLDFVERIEVLNGPGSAIYGTNAMGGVVNIITRTQHEPGFQTRLSIGAGNFNTQEYLLQHSGKFNRLDYYLTGSYRTSDGHRDNSAFSAQTYSLKLGYQLSRHLSLRAFTSMTPYEFEDPGIIGGNPEFESGDIKRYTGDITLENKYAKTTGSVKIHGNWGVHDLADGWHSEDRTRGITIFQNAFLPADWTITLGLDAKEYGGIGENSNLSTFLQNSLGEEYLTEIAGYGNIQKILAQKFIFGAGIRYEHHSLYGGEWLPKIGLTYNPKSRTRYRLTVAKGFRSPTARELYFFPSSNTDLEPERMWNSEVGFSHFFTEWLSFDAAGYHIDASDLIRVNTAVFPNTTINTGAISYSGIELSFKAEPAPGFVFHGSYSHIFSDEILAFSPNKVMLSAGYAQKGYGGTISASHIDNLYAGTTEADAVDDYTVVNFSTYYRINSHIRFRLNLENLFNTEYETIRGYPMPGRTFLGKMNYIF